MLQRVYLCPRAIALVCPLASVRLNSPFSRSISLPLTRIRRSSLGERNQSKAGQSHITQTNQPCQQYARATFTTRANSSQSDSTNSNSSSSNSHSQSPGGDPPSPKPSFVRRYWRELLLTWFCLPLPFALYEWLTGPKSPPSTLAPTSEKHFPKERKRAQPAREAVIAMVPDRPLPPKNSSLEAYDDGEPSSTHADHASCRACRDGESADVNATYRAQVLTPASSFSSAALSSFSDSQSTPIVRSSSAPCPPCYAYSHSLCPLNRAEVGRAAWGYLHTMVAYYPDHPSPQQQHDMAQFINLYMKLYPCGYCADRSVEQLEREPIEKYVASQYELAGWMCRAHNEVNERLGKPIFDCKYVNQRWRDGPPTGECD